MSNSLALEPLPRTGERTAEPAPRAGLRARFMAALESLVSAQSRRFENVDPLMYRYPPI